MKFKETLKRLEKIAEELEEEELSLEDSLKKYEEGIELIQICSKKLDQMKTQLMEHKRM